MEEESEPKAAPVSAALQTLPGVRVQMLLVWRERGVVFPQSISKRLEKVTRGMVEAYWGRNEGPSEQDSNKILFLWFFGRKLSQT